MFEIKIIKTKIQMTCQLSEKYTKLGVKVYCDSIIDKINHKTITYNFLLYYCEEISEWYLENINKITSNTHVSSPGEYIKNKEDIEKILKDLKDNKEEYLDYFTNVKPQKSLNLNDIFIVHGHDEGLLQEIARFIEQIGLKPIILKETPNGGETIIEKIESRSDVGYGIVLYTPCDKGFDTEDPETVKNRARQNVIFEHGYLIGKLGRNRVSAIVKGELETPGDIGGMVYISYDNNWKIALVKELKYIDYPIDSNLII